VTKWRGWNIGDVNSRSDKDWAWFASADYLMHSIGMNKDSNLNITGKHLFFHEDSKILEQIASKITRIIYRTSTIVTHDCQKGH